MRLNKIPWGPEGVMFRIIETLDQSPRISAASCPAVLPYHTLPYLLCAAPEGCQGKPVGGFSCRTPPNTPQSTLGLHTPYRG